MSSRVWGVPYEAADSSGVNIYQPIRFNDDIILKALRTWVIFYNNPAFTNLQMKMYSDNPGALTHAPGKLLHTSTNSFDKDDISTFDNAYREIYFEFNNINIQANTWYNLVLNMSGYAPADIDVTHFAWRSAFPDPVYRTNLSVSIASLNKFPFAVYAIGAQF